MTNHTITVSDAELEILEWAIMIGLGKLRELDANPPQPARASDPAFRQAGRDALNAIRQRLPPARPYRREKRRRAA